MSTEIANDHRPGSACTGEFYGLPPAPGDKIEIAVAENGYLLTHARYGFYRVYETMEEVAQKLTGTRS